MRVKEVRAEGGSEVEMKPAVLASLTDRMFSPMLVRFLATLRSTYSPPRGSSPKLGAVAPQLIRNDRGHARLRRGLAPHLASLGVRLRDHRIFIDPVALRAVP